MGVVAVAGDGSGLSVTLDPPISMTSSTQGFILLTNFTGSEISSLLVAWNIGTTSGHKVAPQLNLISISMHKDHG